MPMTHKFALIIIVFLVVAAITLLFIWLEIYQIHKELKRARVARERITKPLNEGK